MNRCLLVTLLTLVFAVPCHAAGTIAVGTVDGSMTYAGGNYWQNSAGDYFTRKVEYSGFYSYCGQSYPAYWNWSYTSVSRPAAALTPKSSEAEWIDFLKNRETIAGEITAAQQRDEAFLAKLKAVGVTPAFPGLPAYSTSSFGYNKLSVAQGNTIYGTYSYSQVADLYNQTDLNALFQQSAALAKGAQGLAGDANSQFNTVIQTANAGAARVAEIRAEGEIAVEKLRAVRPPSRVVTTINGQQVGPADTAPSPMPKIGSNQTRTIQAKVVTETCLQCHSGLKAEGKLDLAKPLTADQYLAVLNRVSLPVSDKRHMPQSKDGSPGRQLTYEEVRDLIP